VIKKKRNTKETQIQIEWQPNGSGQTDIETGLGFFDHMLELLAFHAKWDLKLKATGDLYVDDHHLVEDVAIVLGTCLDEAMTDVRQSNCGVERYGQCLLPMDETLVLVAVDLCNRSSFVHDLTFSRPQIGQLGTEMVPHFFKTLSQNANMALHIKTMWTENTHHLIEATFKATGRAMRMAFTPSQQPVSTKGSL